MQYKINIFWPLEVAMGVSHDFSPSKCHMDMLEDVSRILYLCVSILKYRYHEISVLSLSHNPGKDLKVI